MAVEENTQSSSIDSLYCEDEKWGDQFEEEKEDEGPETARMLTDQDLFWEDEELNSLFLKENEAFLHENTGVSLSLPLPLQARKDAVEWILKVKHFYGFSALTAILAVNYLDRFLYSPYFQKEKPWMMQLAAVASLSLAAKVEETDPPLLLDLQIEDSKCLFNSKTIKRMELLVLSALKWKMNPVTPLSFLDHIRRRLGLKNNIHWEFLWGCEKLLLSLLTDSRFACYLPSVLATATMLHVIHQVEPCNAFHYENQLLGVLKINKEKVKDFHEILASINSKKRKICRVPSSPSGVIDEFFDSDSSNESWGTVGSSISSTQQPVFKKFRVHEQPMKL